MQVVALLVVRAEFVVIGNLQEDVVMEVGVVMIMIKLQEADAGVEEVVVVDVGGEVVVVVVVVVVEVILMITKSLD